MENPLLCVRNLKKHYPVGDRKYDKQSKKFTQSSVRALDGISFDVYKGEILGVVGESGCGKSTLGRCIMRLIDSTDGEILYNGKDITRLSAKKMCDIRHHMQMVFQNPYSSFNPKITIERSLREVGKFYGMKDAQIDTRIKELMECISLPASMLARHPNELSGGQLQRLAIARALMVKPEFIMADEPVSALDVSVQAQILNLILDLKEQFALTMMFISHELTVVEHVCDRVIVVYLGTMVEMGTTEQLFKNTQHPYTKALISSKPKDLPDEESNRIILAGDIPNAMEFPDGCRF
ncbi:MAG: ABC transporter ATP-binding protein, partial [Oscillospiraceae bacterium]